MSKDLKKTNIKTENDYDVAVEKSRKDYIATARLALGSSGLVLAFLVVFELIYQFVFAPIGRLLWEFALKTTPTHFVSLNNILDALKSPVLVLIGLFVGICYVIIMFFKFVGIITCIEYVREKKPIRLVSVLKSIIRNVPNMVKPKNWGMAIVVGVVVSFMTLFKTNGKLSNIIIPEYIMDVIVRQPILLAVYAALLVVLVIVMVKYCFSAYYFSFEKKGFRDSLKCGSNLVKGRWFKTYFTILLWTLIAYLVFTILPVIISCIVYYLMRLAIGQNSTYAAVSEIILKRYMHPGLMFLAGVFVNTTTYSALTLMFHKYKKENGEEEFSLESDEKAKEKNAHYGVVTVIYAAVIILSIAATFVVTFASEKNPEILADLRISTGVVAHRGYSAVAPENTIPAFQAAIDAGVIEYGELDVHPTKEGIPVVMHDANTLRTTGVDRNICETPLDEIKKLDAGKSFSDKFAGTPVPTLEELMQHCKGKIKLMIEIKNSGDVPEFEDTVAELIEKYDMVDECVIHSLSYQSLERVKKHNKNITCGLIMPIAVGAYYDLEYADFFSIEHTFIDEGTVQELHKRNKKIYAWTVNEDHFIREMTDIYSDYLISDEPIKAHGIVNETQSDLNAYILRMFKIDIPKYEKGSESDI